MSTATARMVSILGLMALSLLDSGPVFAISWVEQGPGPTLDGQDEGLLNNPVSGAINAIAADPTNADVVYVGTVNGGIWKTTNATAASPKWIPLTDQQLPALSINSLAISPVSPKFLFAGTGSTSSDAFDGSPGFGIARSTNGGLSWTVLAASTFAGKRINSIVPTALHGGNVVLAATLFDSGGVYRSTDQGSHFTRLSGDGMSGLPDQGVSSLVADPGDAMRFYAAVPIKAGVATGGEGVYKSIDGGAHWAPVNTGLVGVNTSLRILLSVHNNNSNSELAIVGNSAAFGGGPITTFDFATGTPVNSFVPTGAFGSNNGRGLAVVGKEVFYTELSGSDGFGPTDFIRVAPFKAGAGGADTRRLANPRPGTGIQDLAFSGGMLFALTGYPSKPLQVFGLNPTTGAVMTGPVNIGAPAQATSDGFTVLPNGNFLINNEDESCTYNQYNPSTGVVIPATAIVVPGATQCTGVDTDGASLFFTTSGSFTQTNLSGGVIAKTSANSGRLEDISLVVHTNVVYAMVIGTDGKLSGVFRSADRGVSWTSMAPLPSPKIFPGGQGNIHGAIVADPADPNVVFISGDRQDFPFRNANGCDNFSGNIFRGNASLLPANPWQNVVCSGATGGGSPHADSRAMVFDASGDILHASDGGIYKLANPNVALRRWSSIMGDLRPAEIHSVAYDSVSNIVFGGAQDTGTTIQSAPGSFTWKDLLQGDGGAVAVDSDQIAHAGTSIRYTSFQRFGGFNRTTWDASNTLVPGSQTNLGLNITSGPCTGHKLVEPSPCDPNVQFYNPYVLNAINPNRMLIGTDTIYESMDMGDHLANLGLTGFPIGSLAYGGRMGGVDNPDVFYVGAGPTIRHRVSPPGGPITTLSAYPGSSVRSVVMDPHNYHHVYVLDDQSRVWASFDEGATWLELTANLSNLSGDVRVIEIFNPNTPKDATVLIAGGLGGVFQMKHPATVPKPKWSTLASKLPHGLVLDLHYDYTDNVLVAGILGRGVWTLTRFFPGGKALAAPAETSSERREAPVSGFELTGPAAPLVAPVARPEARP